MQDIRPIGRKILVRKCVTGVEQQHNGQTFYMVDNVAIPEKSHEFQYWCEIIDVSPECRLFTKDMIGSFVRLAEWKPGRIFRAKDEDYIVKEELFEIPAAQGGLPAYIAIGE